MDARFILRSREALSRCLAHIADLPDDPVMEVVVRPHKAKRSLAQNALLHVMIREIAKETGYSETEMKDMLVYRYLGTRTFNFQGEYVETLRETSQLNVEQMHEFLEEVIQFAGRVGVGIAADPELVKEAGL